MGFVGRDKKIDMRDSQATEHPKYADMTIQLPERAKISTKMLNKLDKEFARLPEKQRASYLRSVYYSES